MKPVMGQIEEKVAAALSDALEDTARIQGRFETAMLGEVKTSGNDGRPQVLVAVDPPSSTSYGNNALEFGVSVAVRLDFADDPTISDFNDAVAVVESLLYFWNENKNIADVKAALSTDNFQCCGLALNQGVFSNDFTSDKFTLVMTFQFTVKGRYTTNKGDNL